MAVGDAVNGISADNTILDFQPAAGVEVVITSYGVDNGNIVPVLYNGTIDSNMGSGGTNNNTGVSNTNQKMFINNTNYLRIPAAGAGAFSHYTGITTK